MITECYVGHIRSEKFDFETVRRGGGNSSGCFPEQVGLTPILYSRDLFWDIVDHPEAIKSDWGCCLWMMTKTICLSHWRILILMIDTTERVMKEALLKQRARPLATIYLTEMY